MPNIPVEERLMTKLTGKTREYYESHMIKCTDWNKHPEMPKECWDVVTGDAFYMGLEGIGHTEENGWFLVLYDPDVPNIPESDKRNIPVGDSGLTIKAVGVVSYQPGSGTVYMLYIERGEVIEIPETTIIN